MKQSSDQTQLTLGIEIHQQLDTHKLFCNCLSILRNNQPQFEIKRKLHAVAGESGEVDIAVLHEAQKDNEFIYQGFDSTCLVELDDEPPHLINQEALQIALHISLLLNCEILQISQIMRKTVVDGSNTSGFQRTVLIARNGFIKTKSGKVGIQGIFLEEDSARPSSENQSIKTFKLDRLGIPLVEITTSPKIKTPQQAKEVALHIGDILRSCKVKRGIGTIRQDMNISIIGHPRVEIKGFQDPKMMIKTMQEEVNRQKNNIKSKKDSISEVRGANENGTSDFLRPMPGKARMYPETDLPLLRISKDIINKAKNTLPKLRSEIRDELQKKGLQEYLIKSITQENKLDNFKALLNIINEPTFVAKMIIDFPKEIASHKNIKNINSILTIDIIESILQAIKDNKISKKDVKYIMEKIASGETFLNAIKIEKTDISKIETEIQNIIKEKPNLSIGAYMGLIMQKFKGKISGQEVNDVLNRLIE